jgi:cytochrome c
MRHHQRRLSAIDRAIVVAVLAGAFVLSGCAGNTVASTPREPAQPIPGGDAERGRQVLRAYGCGSCHTIPGVPGATGRVAPPLTGWGDRQMIVGLTPNTPERLVQWIVAPAMLRPGTTMPNVGVSREDALQMAAYLYTLR